MPPVDVLIILVYLMGILAFAVIIGRAVDLEGFLVNNRRTRTVFLIFTIVSTNVGAGTYLGVASAGYESGISYAIMGTAVAIFGFCLTAWLAPRIKQFGDRWKAHTLADFYSVRYGSAARLIVAFVIVVIYIFFLGAQFLGISALLSVWTGWEFEITLVFATLGLIAYTALAGVKSDIYTDIVPGDKLRIIVVLFPLAWQGAGGLQAIRENLPSSYFHPAAFGGWGFLVGAILFGAPVILVSMDVWQRLYAAVSPKTARRSLLLSGLVNLPFLLLPAFLGGAARSIGMHITNPDTSLFELMKRFLPTGALGLALAGCLAAFLSTANTMIMVTSASLLKDLYIPLRQVRPSDEQALRAGRVFTVMASLVGLAIAFLIPSIVRLSLNSFFTLMVLIPSALGGFFWKRATSKGAVMSVVSGALLTWILLPFSPRMAFVPGFLLSAVLLVVGSLLTSHSSSEKPILGAPVKR